MNIIRGLITKDLLQLKSYRRTLIIFIAIFIFTGIVQEDNITTSSMLVIMLTLGFGMFSISTFSYDEMAKADKFILTLPLTKNEIVRSKYILTICSTLVGSILGVIVSLILTFAIRKQSFNFEEIISLAFGAVLGIGLVEGIQIPCIYKYGAEKGRIQIFVITIMMALVIGGIIFIIDKMNINFEINNLLDYINKILPILFIGLTAIIYFISYKISCKIYSKKDI